MRFDAGRAECLVFTFKEGLLSAVAHDLKLRVERFTVEVAEDRSTVEARFDAGSLRVLCAVRGGADDPNALSARNRGEIEDNVRRTVLQAARYPEIVFRSSLVSAARVAGALTLHGRTRPIECSVEARAGGLRATAILHQPDFGIVPYTAMLGTLRVRSDVRVEVTLPGVS